MSVIPIDVAVDAGHIYWTNAIVGTVGRAKLDGTDVEQSFIAGAAEPRWLAVGPASSASGSGGSGGGSGGGAGTGGAGTGENPVSGSGSPAAAVAKPAPEASAAEAAARKQQEEAASRKRQEEAAAKSSAKPPTRAQLLAKALRQCKQQKPKSKRARCEATARKKYGPKKKKKSKK